MKTAFVYAGQGSQKVGMGKDFYDNSKTYRRFVDGLEDSDRLKRLMHEGPIEELSLTENTQGCMAIFAAGVTEVLSECGVKSDVACGLSLGEYGALYAAGVFSASDYVKLTSFRGNAMMEAAKGINCAMSAVLGAEAKQIQDACEMAQETGYVTIANYNCPGQIVICGEIAAVEKAENILKEQGVKRCIRLNVSGPFHTKFMEPAGEKLREYLAGMNFAKPTIPILLNYTGDYHNKEADLKEMLIKQVSNSVRLEDQIRKMIEDGVERFIEIGPGNAVSGFIKKTAKAMQADVDIISIDKYEGVTSLCERKYEG